MTKLLGDLPYVKVYLDDIIIHSRTVAEHVAHVRVVLARLREHKFYVKLRKCEFFQPSIEFLGHVIDAEGLHIAKSKLSVVQEWPAPTNVSEVRSFLGFV